MSGKVDQEFVNFVKSKKRTGKKENKPKKVEEDEEYDENNDELDYEYLNTKRQSEPFNNITSNKVRKVDDEGESLTELLKKNQGKVIQEKKIAITKEESEEEDSEGESSESDDYDENENINHFVGKKKQKIDEDSDEELETLAEMKKFEHYQGEGEEEEEEDEEEEEKHKKEQSKQNKKEEKKKELPKINRNNTIFIGNLPEDVSEETLQKKFSKFGDIKTIRLVKDKDNKPKGFGYIDYETEKAMKTAVAGKVKIADKEIKIEQAKSSYINEVKETNSKKRMGKKKKKAMINKAKEQLKQKNKKDGKGNR